METVNQFTCAYCGTDNGEDFLYDIVNFTDDEGNDRCGEICVSCYQVLKDRGMLKKKL